MPSMREQGKVYHRQSLCRGYNARPILRRANGSQIVEFAAAIILLLTFVLIPCLDLAIVPIRWTMAQELIDSYVRTLSMCETFTESQRMIETDPSLRTRLQKLGGVQVDSLNLRLKITHVSNDPSTAKSLEVLLPGGIPQAWLPNGALAPCTYALDIDVRASIAPALLIKMAGMHIPGLTEPIPVLLTGSHEWTNLGRDPMTEKYFINE